MATPIHLKHSAQAGRVPDAGVLANGELAINTRDVKAYIKNADGQVVQIAGTDNPTNDGRYLRIDADASAQTVESTDPTTFDGLVEAGDGVKVTGGAANSVSSGGAAGTYLNNSGNYVVALDNSNHTNFSLENGVRVTNSIPDGSSGTAGFYSQSDFRSVTGTVDSHICIKAAATGGGNKILDFKGFVADSAENIVPNTADAVGYGYYSDNNNNTSKPNAKFFNFFANGSAPNFFAGSTYIGGTATRNTLELWKSTLTEEQKEQLSAGTLAIPANVSTPGDGSFARQWWYDQQSAEDQALIDSGELEYPKHFQAENFVEPFELGVTTTINLLSNNGRGEFGGGVKISGGNEVGVDTGLYYRNGTAELGLARQGVAQVTFERNRARRFLPDKDGRSFGWQAWGALTQEVTEAVGFSSYFESSTEAIPELTHYYANQLNDVTAAITKGFAADSGLVNGTTATYAFYSNIPNGPGPANYNFYASNSAPNFFKGQVKIGTDSDTEDPLTTNSSILHLGVTPNGTMTVSRGATNPALTAIGINRVGNTSGNLITFYQTGTEVDSIQLDGSGGITCGTSDYRVKENIVDLPSATAAIKSLRPVNFNFNWAPGTTRPGFIAHEVSDVLPAAVVGDKDATVAIGTLADYDGTVLETEVTEPDASELTYTEMVPDEHQTTAIDGEPKMVEVTRTKTWTETGTKPVYQGVDQTKLIPLLTKALQEALERIEALEAAAGGASAAKATAKKK